jgi:hypothetical protein
MDTLHMTDLDGIRVAMENLADEIHALRKGLFRWKILVTLLSSILAIMLAVGVYVGVLLWWPNTPFEFKVLHVPSGQSVQGPLRYHIEACRYTNDPATVIRSFTGVGATHQNYPGVTSASISKEGCHSTNLTIPLPMGMVPGSYQLNTSISFTVHTAPLRVVTLRHSSNVFTLK